MAPSVPGPHRLLSPGEYAVVPPCGHVRVISQRTCNARAGQRIPLPMSMRALQTCGEPSRSEWRNQVHFTHAHALLVQTAQRPERNAFDSAAPRSEL